MMIANYATVLFLATVAVSQEETESRRGYATATLHAGKLEHGFVRMGDAILFEDVVVNGEGPFRFLLDTGAQGAGRVDSAVVDALQLPVVGSTIGVGIGGQRREMTRHPLDSLAIGGLSFRELVVSSRDYNEQLPPALRPLHGVLGYDLFGEYLLTIDYPARTITVEKGELRSPDGQSVLPLSGDDGAPWIEISLGDQTVRALIDTGAMCEVVVPGAVAEELVLIRDSGESPRRTAKLDGTLRIGAVEIMHPQVVIGGSIPHVILGVRALSSLTLTFDQKNSRVLVEQPAERQRYGIHVSKHATEPWVFEGVVAGSLAEGAGLRSTDRLMAINGHALARMGREELDRLLDSTPVTLEVEREGQRLEIFVSSN